MATINFVTIDVPEAHYLADLTGIANDFESARFFATQLKDMFDKSLPYNRLIEPMTTAVLVRYCRPFTSGLRHRVKIDELTSLSPGQKEAHERFCVWRDKHIAHSVNVFEYNHPIARYCVERFDEEGFTSVSCQSYQLIGMSLSDIDLIIQLTTLFIEEIKPKIKSEQEKVLKIVRERPKDTVLGMARPAHDIKVSDVAKTRKQGKKY